jgi:tRNA (guanine-N7-)-methyltransferase
MAASPGNGSTWSTSSKRPSKTVTDGPPGAAAGRRDKLHGRRRGHKLRPGQQTLLDTALAARRSTVAAIADSGPAGIFPTPPREVWLEVGFGGGEHIAWQGAQNPDVGLIGCEVFETGIVTLLAHLKDAAHDNVRIVVDDAHLVLDVLPEASLARAFILFPDPWPKTRHHKRRFVSRETMDLLARALKDGAELRLGTDDIAYLRVMLEVACGHPDFEWLARRPADWRERPADWPQTRYEAKAISQGRPPAFLRLIRRPRG